MCVCVYELDKSITFKWHTTMCVNELDKRIMPRYIFSCISNSIIYERDVWRQDVELAVFCFNAIAIPLAYTK